MVTLIHGVNPYSSRTELSKALAKVDFDVIYADKVSGINELIFPSDNLSLFGNDHKFTVIKNLSKNRKKSIYNELAEYIEKNHKRLNMLLFETAKFDARTKLYKTIKKLGVVIETKTPSADSLLKWINDSLKKEGISTNSTLNQEILKKVGTDQQNLSNELEKLALLVKAENRKELKQDDLDILTENNETVIWEFLDALTSRNKRTALEIFENVYQNDADFPYISAMLAKQLKLLYWLKSGEVSEDSMKSIFKVHPYTIAGIKRNVYKFELNFIKLLYSKLTSLDFKVKQGRIDAKLGLIMLIASV